MQRVARELAITFLRTSRWGCSGVQKCRPKSLRFKQTVVYILSVQQNVRTACLRIHTIDSLILLGEKSNSVPRFLLILQL